MTTDNARVSRGLRQRSVAGGESDGARSWRRTAAALLGPAVSVLCLAAVVVWALGQDAPSFPADVEGLSLIAGAVALYGLAWLVRGVRWHWILRRAEVAHDERDAHALVAVGYMGNTVLPARGGELLRIVMLSRRSSALKRDVLGSTIAERVLDGTALLVLFVVMTWTRVAGAPVGQAPAMIAALGAIAVAAAVVVYLRARSANRFTRVANLIRPFTLAARRLIGRFGIGLLAMTMAVWAIEGVICVLVGESLGLGVNLVEGLFIVVLAGCAAMVPAGPGFVGTFDAAVLFALHAIDVTGGDAVAFAVLLRFVLFVPITILGVGLLIGRYGGVRALRRVAHAR